MITGDVFERERPRLFGIAYRMLHSVADAEDVCQEAWLRVARRDDAPDGSPEVRDPARYLTRVVARLCLDRLRRDRSRREEYVGPWLPEPLPTTGDEPDPNAESLSMAFLVLLESLSPVERAVFLLRQVFDLDYADVAAATGKTEAHCRQLLRRARQHVEERRPRFETPSSQHDELMLRFGDAWRRGDLAGLVELLAADARLTSDGGGKASAARVPIDGAEAIARFLLGVAKQAPPGLVVQPARINHASAVVTYEHGVATSALVFHIAEGRVTAIFAIRNPDKLKRL